MSPKALDQTAGKMVLPFTEVRKTEEKQDSWGCTRSSILEKSSFKCLSKWAYQKKKITDKQIK